MQIKQFYTNHKSLCGAIFWACMTVVIFLFQPQPPVTATPIEAPTKIEVSPTATIELSRPLPTPKPKPPRYGFTKSDIYLMSVLLTGSKYVGGDGEFDFDYGRDNESDQIGLVLSVVMNRVRSGVYPNTVSEVIWQKGQFALMPRWRNKLPEVSDISLQRVTAWCKAYDAHDPDIQSVPQDHLYFSGDGRNNHSR